VCMWRAGVPERDAARSGTKRQHPLPMSLRHVPTRSARFSRHRCICHELNSAQASSFAGD
jgi:hypothetical protein